MVGGRSDAALRRTAVHGDGWLAIWVSPRRFSDAIQQVQSRAASGRRSVDWAHGINIWTGIDPDATVARASLEAAIWDTYKMPLEKFERWSPSGPPNKIAEFVLGYVKAGAKRITLAAVGASPEKAFEHAGTVRRLVLAG